MVRFIAGLVCLFALPVHADSWTGIDKTHHAAVGAIIGAAIAASKDPVKGCVAATMIGAGKEFYDHQHSQKHTASFKDFAVTAGFGCASAYITGLVITPSELRYTFKFSW
jgi:uncharacterized protein YfiM (DUF2279 family)